MADCFDCGLRILADHAPRIASGQTFHPTPSHCVSALLANCDGMRVEVARLTSELAEAREANRVAADEFAATIKGIGKLRANAERWCWMFPDSPLVSVTERMQRVYRKWDGCDSWNDAVDAARRAGEGEK